LACAASAVPFRRPRTAAKPGRRTLVTQEAVAALVSADGVSPRSGRRNKAPGGAEPAQRVQPNGGPGGDVIDLRTRGAGDGTRPAPRFRHPLRGFHTAPTPMIPGLRCTPSGGCAAPGATIRRPLRGLRPASRSPRGYSLPLRIRLSPLAREGIPARRVSHTRCRRPLRLPAGVSSAARRSR
jgi:hypothetical protein